MSTDDHQQESPFALALSRRHLLAATGGLAAAAAVHSFVGPTVRAQQGPATPNALGSAIPPELTEFAEDWPAFQGNLSSDRAARGSTITSENVGTLDVAWTFTSPNTAGYGSFTSAPLVLGDVVYIQDTIGSVFALDRESGEIIWTRPYNVPSIGPAGIAVGYGQLYGVLREKAEVFALDLSTGDEIWRVKVTNFALPQSSAAPTVYDNTVYVEAGAGYLGGGKSSLIGLDAASGLTLWQFDLMEDNGWTNPRLNSGGGLWYPLSFDEDGNLYFGVGNPAPYPGTADFPNGSSRPGDNLYSSSMVSLDSKTGELRWFYQARQHDIFDLDFQNTPVLAKVDLDGTTTTLAIGSGKTGTVAAVNAETGEVLWNVEVGEHDNDDLGEVPEGESVTVLPGTLGGVETPIAFSDGLVFVPVLNFPTTYTSSSIESGSDYSEATGDLYALNAVDGTTVWQQHLPSMATGSATVANDVVFTAGLDGIVRAYLTTSGDLLWTAQLTAGVNAPSAIAGDTIFVPAGGPLVASSDTGSATPIAEGVGNQLVAFRISEA
jgi:glucose dehydrogenase